MGYLTIETTIEQLMRDERYKISGYAINRDAIILFVTDLNAEQKEIPKTMNGRDVRIFKSL